MNDRKPKSTDQKPKPPEPWYMRFARTGNSYQGRSERHYLSDSRYPYV